MARWLTPQSSGTSFHRSDSLTSPKADKNLNVCNYVIYDTRSDGDGDGEGVGEGRDELLKRERRHELRMCVDRTRSANSHLKTAAGARPISPPIR
jgi:hypothetical protein